jgi:histidyl-tRNA synthetase
MKLQAIRGMNDVLPADTPLWRHLHDTAAALFARYGYAELRLPLVERTELFKRAVGEVTDIVEKEMYVFDDRDGESLALRPELTAGVVRAGIEHGLLYNQQQRLWCAGPVFRYERPQAGRYRQFHQLDVEAYGIKGPDIDIELIALSARLWRELGFEGLRLEINSLGTTDSRARYRAALIEFLNAHESALDADSRRRLHSNPLRVLDSKVETTQSLLRDAPNLLDFLDDDSRRHFDGWQQGLGDLGIAFQINPRLVRGLDYYTNSVFEWITTELGAQGTICAGGRYDRLVEQLGGAPTPAIGWASGVERLLLLLQKQRTPAATGDVPHAYFCVFDETERQARRLAEQLREALPGLRLQLNAGGGKLAAQLKRADKCGARLALILGTEEAASRCIQVKFLREPAEPQRLDFASCAQALAGLLGFRSGPSATTLQE